MSKFFVAAQDLSSDSETSSSSEEEQVEEVKKVTAIKPQKKKKFQESSDESEEERTIKSGSAKMVASFNAVVKNIKNHLKNNDYSSLMDDFDKFIEEIVKLERVVGEKDAEPIVMRNLARFEESITSITPEMKKKLNKNNSQGFNKLKQKVNKLKTQEFLTTKQTYQELLEKFKENPVASDEEEKASPEKSKKPKKQAKKQESESESDSDESGSDDESSESDSSEGSESSSEDEDEEQDENLKWILKADPTTLTLAQRRLRWVKKEFLPWNQKAEDKGQGKKKKNDEDQDRPKDTERDIAETNIMLDEDFKIDFSRRENVIKKLKEMKDTKKKGKQNSLYDTSILKFMIEHNKELRLVTEMKLLLVIAYIDAAQASAQISVQDWNHTNSVLNEVIDSIADEDKRKEISEPYPENIVGDYFFQAKEVTKTFIPLLVGLVENLGKQLYRSF